MHATRLESEQAPVSDVIGIEGALPVFLCTQGDGNRWTFRCTCGQIHSHSAHPGRRVAHCGEHHAGYVLAAPIGHEQ